MPHENPASSRPPNPSEEGEFAGLPPSSRWTGRVVILFIFGVTLVMAGFAIWYRQAAGRRSRELFGVEHGQRIQLADQIHAMKLEDPPADLTQWTIPQEGWEEVTRVSGMTHLQGAIMEDRSFQWPEKDEATGAGQSKRSEQGDGEARQIQSTNANTNANTNQGACQWHCAFRFRDESGDSHLLFDVECAKVRLLETGAEASFAPMATFVRRFIHQLYPEESGKAGESEVAEPRNKSARPDTPASN